MENNHIPAEQLKKLRQRISKIQKILDLLRQLFGLQTQLEKLEWEEIARNIAGTHGIDEDIFAAVLYCESGMNPKAVNRNKNGTTDYGICQFNDYWYGSIISPDEALNQPVKALNIMAKMWKKGRQKDWICYRNKKYIPWLQL